MLSILKYKFYSKSGNLQILENLDSIFPNIGISLRRYSEFGNNFQLFNYIQRKLVKWPFLYKNQGNLHLHYYDKKDIQITAERNYANPLGVPWRAWRELVGSLLCCGTIF